ncbi:MAG: hypothetical protein HOD03_01495 [Planctomycetes bacterium]|nr:hypothetical protein [Planctomycetota bacterium]
MQTPYLANAQSSAHECRPRAIRKVFQESPEAFEPRKYLTPAMTAMPEICMLRYKAFNTAGQAGKIKEISLADMAASYNYNS